jgi:hypothetical protein
MRGGAGHPNRAALIRALVAQVKMPSLFTLNAAHRAFGSFHLGFPIQRYPDGKCPTLVASNNLNAAYRLAARPLSDRV